MGTLVLNIFEKIPFYSGILNLPTAYLPKPFDFEISVIFRITRCILIVHSKRQTPARQTVEGLPLTAIVCAHGISVCALVRTT